MEHKEAKEIKKLLKSKKSDEIEKTIRSCKLFEGTGEEIIHLICKNCKVVKCAKNETLDISCGLYIISTGEIKAQHIEDGKKVTLNTLGVHEVFGYASLYSPDNDRYTEMTAGKPSELIFIDAPTVEEIIKSDSRIALEIISALTNKIRFLNKKIDSFVSGDLKKRLLKYLKSLPESDGGKIMLPDNMSALARKLGVGRASLYRLMKELINEGIIEKNQNEIIFIEQYK